MTKDMTQGSPLKLILLFSLPLIIGNIFQQFYSMVDTIIVGRYISSDALAAVGSTGSMSFLVLGFVMGITSGFAVITAQRFGAKDYDGVRRSVATSIVLCSIITILLTFVSVVSCRYVLELMNTPANIIDDAYAYIVVIYAGLFTAVAYNMMASILRALGDSKSPLYFLIIASLLNIVLDIVFILNFKMGPAGAAYATVISQGISAVLCFFYIYKKYPMLHLLKSDFKEINWIFSCSHLNVGIPMALQFSITALGAVVLQSALNNFGSTHIAAYTSASKVQQLVMQPFISFGVTMATYCGQNLGAKKYDRIIEGVRKCSMITITFSLLSSVFVVVCGRSFTQLFINDGNTLIFKYAQEYLNTTSIFYFPLAMIFVHRNSLQGMGDGFIPMMAGVGELIARFIAAFTLPTLFGFIGICLADPCAWLAAEIPLSIKYHFKKKELKQLIIKKESVI